MEIKDFIDLKYNNLKDKGLYDDLNNDELTTRLIFESSNLMSEIIYLNRKFKVEERDIKIKDLFNNISILTKINNIDLVE